MSLTHDPVLKQCGQYVALVRGVHHVYWFLSIVIAATARVFV